LFRLRYRYRRQKKANLCGPMSRLVDAGMMKGSLILRRLYAHMYLELQTFFFFLSLSLLLPEGEEVVRYELQQHVLDVPRGKVILSPCRIMGVVPGPWRCPRSALSKISLTECSTRPTFCDKPSHAPRSRQFEPPARRHNVTACINRRGREGVQCGPCIRLWYDSPRLVDLKPWDTAFC
jgi:hypothetical protein